MRQKAYPDVNSHLVCRRRSAGVRLLCSFPAALRASEGQPRAGVSLSGACPGALSSSWLQPWLCGEHCPRLPGLRASVSVSCLPCCTMTLAERLGTCSAAGAQRGWPVQLCPGPHPICDLGAHSVAQMATAPPGSGLTHLPPAEYTALGRLLGALFPGGHTAPCSVPDGRRALPTVGLLSCRPPD